MVITAFKTNQDLYDTHNNPYLFNSSPTLRHLSLLFEDTQYLQWLLNTGFVGVVVVVITLLLSCAGRCLFLGLDDGAACLIASVPIAIICNFFAARFVGAIK
jgi:ABC-type spermidine/putrescine transport system permease subunit II